VTQQIAAAKIELSKESIEELTPGQVVVMD